MPDEEADLGERRTLLAAANRVLRGEIAARARELAEAPDAEFELAASGQISLARRRGRAACCPAKARSARTSNRCRAIFWTGICATACASALRRSSRRPWSAGWRPLYRARSAELAGPARGLVYQLAEALGTLPARDVAQLTAALQGADRKALARLGVRLGTESVYLEPLLKPRAARLRALLWSARTGAAIPQAPESTSAPRELAVTDEAYAAMGFCALGPRVLRADRLERVAAAARRLARQGPFAASAELASLAGAPIVELPAILAAMGYRASVGENGEALFHARRHRAGAHGKRTTARAAA